MIAVVDYDTGNLRSVDNAFRRIGVEAVFTDDHAVIRSADRVLLPGVGEASSAMAKLRERGLDRLIPSLTQPVLGICIGMQLMCLTSEEGAAECMGIFDTDVVRFSADKSGGVKVPHMGWNTVSELSGPLFDGIASETFFYFVHSFAPRICRHTVAQTWNGVTFSAALQNGNFFGTQFHPEKSGEAGRRLLENFMKL